MTIPSWLRSLKQLLQPSRSGGPRRKPLRHRPALEPLEDRVVPALGDSLAEAGFSAKHILAVRPGVSSGAYWIDPTGGSHADAFQAYCDMVTDGGGWILAVNSVLGSEAATNDITANTGTVGLTTGHTRNVDILGNSQEAQLRHEIDASNQGQGVYHARFNGNHSRRLDSFGGWTTLPGHTNPNLLNAHFGEAFFAFGPGFEAFGAPWYYPSGGPTFSAIPATPVNGTTGPAINSNPSQLINAYRIWVREVAAPDVTPPTVTATTPSLTGGTLTAGNTSLQVTFSEPVVGGDTAANYELRRVGADGLLGTADDPLIPLTVSYSGTTATLSFAALPDSVYRLTVRDTITDATGNALDGDGNGSAGGYWVRDFVVGAAHTLISPRGYVFDTQIGGIGAGQLVQGTNNTFDGLNRLQVGGIHYTPSLPTAPGVNTQQATSVSGHTVGTSYGDVPGLTATVLNAGTHEVSTALTLTDLGALRLRFAVNGVGVGQERQFAPSDGQTTIRHEGLVVFSVDSWRRMRVRQGAVASGR